MKKILICIATVLMLASCGKKEASSERVYTVASDATYSPFEWQDSEGNVIGFAPEVTRAIAKKIGINVDIRNTPWEGIFSTLDQGTSDLIVSSVSITEKRKETMDFSDPYFTVRLLIAVHNTSKIKSMSDLKSGKYKIAVQSGTTGDEVAKRLLGVSSTQIKRFGTTPLALDELKNGGADAVIGDNAVIQYYISQKKPPLRVISDNSFGKDYFGMAVKKGNTELLEKINDGLAQIKADGTYDKIFKKYFN